MPSINEGVHKYLDRNPKIVDNLSEGIINVRALSSKIINDLKLDATAHAVMSAIRRYDGVRTTTEKKWIFNDAKISTKSRLVAISFTRNFKILKNILPELYSLIDPNPGELLRIYQSRKKVVVVVDHAKKDEVLKLIPKDLIISVKDNVAEIIILFGDHPGPGGARAMILHELANYKITIHEVNSCMPEFMLLLDHSAMGKAHELLLDLFYG